MHVSISTVGALPGDSTNAPLFVNLLELFYFNKLICRDIFELLARAARGPCDFYGSNSRCLPDTDVLH